MPPLTRKRRSTQVDPNERRRKAAQRRKRRFGAFKKVHELHTICDYTVACFVINQETGQAYSYRSTDHELWQPLMENVVSLPEAIAHLKAKTIIAPTQPSVRASACPGI